MATRMTHPAHGAMHAYSAGEIEQLQKLGWLVDAPAASVAPIAPVVAEPDPVAPTVEAEPVAPRKPGRPPKAK